MLRAIFAGRDPDARLQHVLEQLPSAAFLAIQGSGGLAAVNGKAAALTEYSRDELLARSLAEVVVMPAAADALEQIHHLDAGQARNFGEVPIRTRSGRPVLADLRVSAQAARQNGEQLVLILAAPVEERQAVEQVAAKEARRLDALQRLVGLLDGPDETALDEAVVLAGQLLNAEAAGLYQNSPEQPGMRLIAFSGEASGFPARMGPGEAHYLQSPQRWTASQRPQGYLHQAARNAGWSTLMVHPIGATNATVGAVCVVYRPGTQPPAQAQRLLALAAHHLHLITTEITHTAKFAGWRDLSVRLTEQLAAISAQVQEGIATLNREGGLDEINSAAARMLGYRSEDVTGRPFQDILIGEEALAEMVQASLQPASVPASLECRLLRRNGESFPASVRLQPLPSGGCVITLQDLSQARASAVRQEHLDQLAFMGQTTQAFAHEVRNPLNGISMGVQFLAARISDDPELTVALGKIQAECARLSGLMTDMLAWAKPVAPNLQPTDLDPVLRRLLARFSLKMKQRNVHLNYTVEPQCPQVLADARLLEHVFVNLVDNALQAMPAGGHLSVSLGNARRGAGVPMVEARVLDEGPGISDEARRRIFDPYFTTKPDGTGLGLAICKRLVTIHHGAIGVDSFPGTGSLFTVTLPAYLPERSRKETP